MFVISPEKLFKNTDFSECSTVIVAISGGSDSTALLFLVKEYMASLQNPVQILAITVDHDLRKESAHEAKEVAKLCKSIGIMHKIAKWAGQKPQTALSEQARLARYELLIHEAKKAKASVILTGHTLNDQVETYIMRKSRGSLRGLAVMARESLLMQKVKLIRPLLAIKRQELRQYLHTIGQGWIDDPSNENRSYERVRVRQTIQDDDIAKIHEEIKIAAKNRQKQSLLAANLFQEMDCRLEHGVFFLKKPDSHIINNVVFYFTLATIAAIMGGSNYLASERQTLYLQEKFAKKYVLPYRFTLLGAIIEINNKSIRIWRENRNIATKTLAPQLTTLWDGRFYVENLEDYAIRIKAPSLSDIKTEILRQNLDKKNIHFPSLQTSIAIYSRQGIDIPALNGKMLYVRDIKICFSLQPFVWIVSLNDYAFYKVLKDFFAQNWHLCGGICKKLE